MIIINLKEDFEHFWKKAQPLSHSDRVALWNTLIEKKHKSLFDDQVWRVQSRENWQSFKEEKLQESFSYYETNFQDIMNLFDHFQYVLNDQCTKYQSTFSDADFSSIPFYVLPSCMTFNGRGGSSPDYPDQPVMYIGVDFISKRQDDLDLFFSHELFHMYHIDRMGVNENIFMNEGRLTLPLWLEGLATYVSGEFCPGRSVSELLMDSNFIDVGESIVPELASEVLKVADKPIRHNEMKTFQSLFNFQTEPFIDGLPSRIGYFLGYYAVREVLKSNNLSEVIFWDHTRAHSEIVKALLELQLDKPI